MNIFNKHIATFIAIVIIVLHYVPFSPLNLLVTFGYAPFVVFYGFPINPLIIQTVGHILLFLFFGMLYYRKIKKDKKNNVFKITPLLFYYFSLLFSIHQLYYFLIIFIRGDRYDANDFIGVMFTSYESCFIFIIFGVIIDFIKNTNGIPKIKLY